MDDVDIAMRELSKFPKKIVRVENEPYAPPFRLIGVEDVGNAICASKASIYRWCDKSSPHYDPTFPQPLKFGGRNTRWRADEITEWMLGLKRGVGDPVKNVAKTHNAKLTGC